MEKTIIKFIIINNLQYNARRDPQVYRRVAGQPFRIRVGGGSRVRSRWPMNAARCSPRAK